MLRNARVHIKPNTRNAPKNPPDKMIASCTIASFPLCLEYRSGYFAGQYLTVRIGHEQRHKTLVDDLDMPIQFSQHAPLLVIVADPHDLGFIMLALEVDLHQIANVENKVVMHRRFPIDWNSETGSASVRTRSA